MIKAIAITAVAVAIPCLYFGYDYGMAKEKERSQVAAEKLTTESVKEAEKVVEKQEKTKVVYRDIIKTVEVSIDESKCLDAHPGIAITNGLRQLQSKQSSDRPKIATDLRPSRSGS